MKYLLYIITLLSPVGVSAQVDNPSGAIAIPRSPNTTLSPRPALSPDSPFALKKPEQSLRYEGPKFEVGQKKQENSVVVQETEFASRADEYKERATPKPEGQSSDAFKGNQFFGEIRTKSKYVDVAAADFGAEDGDRIRVWLNDRVIIDDLTLSNYTKGIQIMLYPGFNKIEFEALNQGTQGPNTADFRLYDDQKLKLTGNAWNLATGFKATIIIVKEEETKSP